jgi:uncharacterized FlgJ-related protein
MASRYTAIFIAFFFIFFTSFAQAKEVKVNKEQFIAELLPIVKEIKIKIGGNANHIPNSFIIAQAIYESSWGKRYPPGNLFGLMSKQGKPLRFPSVESGTEFYIKNLLSHRAYGEFQYKIQNWETNPFVLVSHIKAYSGNPSEYAKNIISIIKSNNLLLLDEKIGDFSKEGESPLFFILNKIKQKNKQGIPCLFFKLVV